MKNSNQHLNRIILAIIFLSFLNFNAKAENKSNQKSNPLPNIIFILADDMGYSDMSWQGSPIQTPNLDWLADEGMFLSRNYVQPQCTPSRTAFLTGNYPYRYGLHEGVLMTNSMHGIPDQEKTIAEKLKEAGYYTAVIGKWHVGCHLESQLPHNQGFDYSFYCIHGAISYWNYTTGENATVVRNGEKYYASSPQDGEASGNTYSTFMWKNEAVELIEDHSPNQPLFLYLPFNAPHVPLQAPKSIQEKYQDVEVDPYWSGPDAILGRNAANRRLYMAMVDVMDQAIGEVVKALEKKGILDNTLIVFCSDNGGIEEADNRPLRNYKGDSFEGGVRVPGIAYWPGKIKPGTTSSELVYMADWYKTFAEIAGLKTEGENKDSKNALEILLGGKGERDYVPIISAARHAYITRDYSLVGSGENYQRILNQNFSAFRLYDLKNDLAQQDPVDSLPQLEQQMKEKLKSHFQRIQRGYFNWDIMYGKYRPQPDYSDHDLDYVINDLPEMHVNRKGSEAVISISPVSEELMYTLQSTQDGEVWADEATYVCKTDEDEYTFQDVKQRDKNTDYRVITSYHYGLPIYDSFSIKENYKPGPLRAIPDVKGFLPHAEVTGEDNVRIIERNLTEDGLQGEGGALKLYFNNYNKEPSFTRFFIQPFNQGKVYTSFLIQYEGRQQENNGEVNWLVQNGWNGPTRKQVTLLFQQDGIYVDKADPVLPYTKKWLTEHDQKVVRVLLEFDLGPTGQDELKVYINPVKGEELPIPHAIMQGEFTFDRLQFRLTTRASSTMIVDDLRVGRKIADVL